MSAEWWDEKPKTPEELARLRGLLIQQEKAGRAGSLACPCGHEMAPFDATRCHHCGVRLCRRCADRHFGPAPVMWDPDTEASTGRSGCAPATGPDLAFLYPAWVVLLEAIDEIEAAVQSVETSLPHQIGASVGKAAHARKALRAAVHGCMALHTVLSNAPRT